MGSGPLVADDIAPDATAHAVAAAVLPPKPDRSPSRLRQDAERKKRNKGKPGEQKLSRWLAAEATRSGMALASVKSYHSAGMYRDRIRVRRVNHAVQWATPIPGAPKATVYPGRGHGRSLGAAGTVRKRGGA